MEEVLKNLIERSRNRQSREYGTHILSNISNPRWNVNLCKRSQDTRIDIRLEVGNLTSWAPARLLRPSTQICRKCGTHFRVSDYRRRENVAAVGLYTHTAVINTVIPAVKRISNNFVCRLPAVISPFNWTWYTPKNRISNLITKLIIPFDQNGAEIRFDSNSGFLKNQWSRLNLFN